MSVRDFVYIPYTWIAYLFSIVAINFANVYRDRPLLSYGISTEVWFITIVLLTPIIASIGYDIFKKYLEEY